MKTTKKTFARAAQALSLVVMAAAVVTLSNCKKDDNGGGVPDPELEVGRATKNFTYAADTADIEVYCNDAWTATVDAAAAAWCSASPASSNGDGFVTITVTNNAVPTGSDRAATVTITSGDLTTTVAVTQELIQVTLCEECLWSGSTWVSGYVTTNDYPFDDAASTHTGLQWSGNGNTYYDRAVSDVDGRANTAAIESVEGSAVQTCKDLGAGWYLPAYEELYNMSAGNATWSLGMAGQPPLNGKALGGGANLLNSGWYWSSTEFADRLGRYSLSDAATEVDDVKKLAIYVNPSGDCVFGYTSNSTPFYCVWQQPEE